LDREVSHELPEFGELTDKFGPTYRYPARMEDIVAR
jgi:hypothetical protein